MRANHSSAGRLAIAATGKDEMAAILFTSGSTGVPKGAVYTHGIFAAQVDILRRLYGIQAGEIDLPAALARLGLRMGPPIGFEDNYAIGGRYDVLRPGISSGLNPLQLPDTPANRQFVIDWLQLLAGGADEEELARIRETRTAAPIGPAAAPSAS